MHLRAIFTLLCLQLVPIYGILQRNAIGKHPNVQVRNGYPDVTEVILRRVITKPGQHSLTEYGYGSHRARYGQTPYYRYHHDSAGTKNGAPNWNLNIGSTAETPFFSNDQIVQGRFRTSDYQTPPIRSSNPPVWVKLGTPFWNQYGPRYLQIADLRTPFNSRLRLSDTIPQYVRCIFLGECLVRRFLNWPLVMANPNRVDVIDQLLLRLITKGPMVNNEALVMYLLSVLRNHQQYVSQQNGPSITAAKSETLRKFLLIFRELELNLDTMLKQYSDEFSKMKTLLTELITLMQLQDQAVNSMNSRTLLLDHYLSWIMENERSAGFRSFRTFLQEVLSKVPNGNVLTKDLQETNWRLPFSKLPNITYGSLFYFPELHSSN